MRLALAGLLGLVSAAVGASPLHAQLDVSGYLLSMGSRSGSSTLVPSGTTLLGRGRLMAAATRGPIELDVAYEHVATRSTRGGSLGLTTPGVTTGTDWVDADWEIWSSDRSAWRHRFDRFSVAWAGSDVEVTVGRQAISWATTLFLTPADPFVPFDPSDPFRVYRAGVDAARIRYFPGPFTELEIVARPAQTPIGRTTTVLARAQTSAAGWAIGGWAGALHDELAGAVFATGAVGATAVRAELTLRDSGDRGARARGTLGVDRYFTPGGRDAYVLIELQYDGFGAAGASKLLETASSNPFARGEMQVLSRWTSAAQVTYQVHPLVGLDALALASLEDVSMLVAPGVGWSATSDASVRAGLFWGTGPEGASPTELASEYGAVPAIGYLSVTWFF